MKNYDETINTVFKRINEYETEKEYKRKFMVKMATSLCCVCFVALLAFGVLKRDWSKKEPPLVTQENSLNPQPTTNKSETEDIPQDKPIVWGADNDDSTQSMGYAQWNSKRITLSLHNVLIDEKNKDSLIAVGVAFELDDNFLYNGKSLKEYESDIEKEHLILNRMGELLKVGDSLKYKETLYTTGDPDGKKWSKQLYEETVERIGNDLLEKYIVEGQFLKEKLEKDILEYDKEEICRIAFETACEAYNQFAMDNAVKQLEEQNISYEIRSDKGLVAYVTANQFSALKLDNVFFYSLAIKEVEGMDMSEICTDDIITGY